MKYSLTFLRSLICIHDPFLLSALLDLVGLQWGHRHVHIKNESLAALAELSGTFMFLFFAFAVSPDTKAVERRSREENGES